MGLSCSPKNPALLGLNVGGGVHVKLRLRRPNRDWDFFPFDQVLDTMLHELCHNVHGPHNANFYTLWDQLRKVLNFRLSMDYKYWASRICRQVLGYNLWAHLFFVCCSV